VFERDYKGCKFLSLQRHSFSHSELHSDRNTTLVDYTIVSGALIALWFDLCVELYDLENKRPLVVNHPDISSNAACMACSELNNKVVILVGDLEGNIHNWVISQQASSYRCQRGAHMKR
jgi:WD40 repeat protein